MQHTRTLSVTEALERLASPDAFEAFSALTGDPILVVDLDAGGRVPGAQEFDVARTILTQLPCPSVALCTESSAPTAAELLDHFDVVVGSAEELTPILEAVQQTPLAALTLVQLLRHSAQLSIHEGLIAESLVYSTLQSGPEFRAWLDARPDNSPPQPGLEPAVLVTLRGDCLELTLNRPGKRNAFSTEMRDALVEALQLVMADQSLHEVLLSGAGSCFCSGGDLDEFGTLPDPATAHAIRSIRNPARMLAACADRVRCQLHDACVGAGVELPAFARRVVASEDAFFQLPELAMGLVPGAGGTVSLPRRIGRQRTAYLALSGQRLDAATARRWGLVDAVRT